MELADVRLSDLPLLWLIFILFTSQEVGPLHYLKPPIDALGPENYTASYLTAS